MLVTAIPSLAESLGVNRIVDGGTVTHPMGAPDVTSDEEHAYRTQLFEVALNALNTSVSGPTVFSLERTT